MVYFEDNVAKLSRAPLPLRVRSQNLVCQYRSVDDSVELTGAQSAELAAGIADLLQQAFEDGEAYASADKTWREEPSPRGGTRSFQVRIHRIGTHRIDQFDDWQGRTVFQPYDEQVRHPEFDDLEEALVYSLAVKYERKPSMAGTYFLRMIGKVEGPE